MNADALHAFYNFKPRPVDAWIFEDERVWKNIEASIKSFPSYVLPSIERPAAIVGVVPNGLGVAEVWMITGIGFERQSLRVGRIAADLCSKAIDLFSLHRLHMAVDAGRDDAARYAERIGFKRKELVEKIGSRGQDIIFYVYERKV